MKNKTTLFLSLLGIILILSFLSAACQATPEKESKPSKDWSRSVELGNYVTGSIGMAVEGAGQRVHLVWPANVGEGTYLRYVQLDSQATPIIEQNLDLPGLLRAPRLIEAAGGRLHLIWSSRPAGEKNWTIWHALLDAQGALNGVVSQVSLSEVGVGTYVVISDHKGGAVICWDSSTSDAIYLQRLDEAGIVAGEPALITLNGKNPSIWVDAHSQIYFTWQEAGRVIYSHALLTELSNIETTVIGEFPQGTGRTIQGPYLGVAGDWAYVFWSVLNQSGLEEGTGYIEYTSFAIDTPSNTSSGRVLLYPDEEQPYAPYQGSFGLTQLVPPVEQAWATSDYILSPSVMQGSQSGELAVAMAMNQLMRMDTHLQIAVAVFRDGQFTGYTLGTKTENISDNPVLFVDTEMQLHLAWREGAAGKSVYYATTQPEAVAELERLGAGDILNAIFQGSMEGLVGATFLPIIGFGWLLPGMILMVVVKLFRDQDVLTEWKYWIPLAIALLMYYLVKLVTLPTISTYVPFSAWLDIPERFEIPLRIGVPVLILITAILVANVVRRRKSQSATLFYITFVLVDATLTLIIYGVNFLGSY